MLLIAYDNKHGCEIWTRNHTKENEVRSTVKKVFKLVFVGAAYDVALITVLISYLAAVLYRK